MPSAFVPHKVYCSIFYIKRSVNDMNGVSRPFGGFGHVGGFFSGF
ncbi:hypothetical protein EMIT040CA3_50038 [Bacillus pseudomycoides]